MKPKISTYYPFDYEDMLSKAKYAFIYDRCGNQGNEKRPYIVLSEDKKLNKLRAIITKTLLPYLTKFNISLMRQCEKLNNDVLNYEQNIDKIEALRKKAACANDTMRNIQQATFKKNVADVFDYNNN